LFFLSLVVFSASVSFGASSALREIAEGLSSSELISDGVGAWSGEQPRAINTYWACEKTLLVVDSAIPELSRISVEP
jgi:hypothetical protein